MAGHIPKRLPSDSLNSSFSRVKRHKVTTPSNQSLITNHQSPSSPGARLRTAIERERPLQMVGTINAFCALLAERAGFRAVYLSGAGVANASFGLPDLGMTNLNDICEDVRMITGATDLPLMARTDAVAGEGIDPALERCEKYVEAGADLIFAEAVTSLDDYRRFTERLRVPVLANLTEFGKTPLFSVEEMRAAGIRVVLYPLSAFRAMAAAAEGVYETIHNAGTQKSAVSAMQTRDHLYEVLNYHDYESKLDSFSKY